MPEDWPYRSYDQPFTAYTSLLVCLFTLLGANGAVCGVDGARYHSSRHILLQVNMISKRPVNHVANLSHSRCFIAM
ncbi:hypothetical protein BDU57DRAFT_510062 [Ampelomyces quisqualis]|uniref:Uncharacterized protein n=1 Tax=Ampelomyces quisqualis TaxID=50730 RepID=A0A6A5R0W0_AMPQU|nr:hypothetical protein BDU57DRAFT_510062 [Ampelomyces quisqualis]